MFNRRLFLLAGPACAAGCAPRLAPAPPPPAPPPSPVGLPERVRREPWLTRFWEQLTPAQRNRVLARLRRAEPPVTDAAAAAPVWDSLGLPERDALVFGAGLRRVE